MSQNCQTHRVSDHFGILCIKGLTLDFRVCNDCFLKISKLSSVHSIFRHMGNDTKIIVALPKSIIIELPLKIWFVVIPHFCFCIIRSKNQYLLSVSSDTTVFIKLLGSNKLHTWLRYKLSWGLTNLCHSWKSIGTEFLCISFWCLWCLIFQARDFTYPPDWALIQKTDEQNQDAPSVNEQLETLLFCFLLFK